MLSTVLRSGLIGLFAGAAAWVVAVILVGADDIFEFRDWELDWPTTLAIAGSAIVLTVVMSLSRIVEPMIAIVAAVGAIAVLYDSREIPFLENKRNLDQVSGQYWAVVGLMIVVFVLLLVGLRISRSRPSR